jgi:threonyl-tRNA synthetase
VSNADYACLETEMKSIVKEKQNFERLEVRKEVLMEMFKVHYIFYFYVHKANCVIHL